MWGRGQLVTNLKPGLVLDEINRLASSLQTAALHLVIWYTTPPLTPTPGHKETSVSGLCSLNQIPKLNPTAVSLGPLNPGSKDASHSENRLPLITVSDELSAQVTDAETGTAFGQPILLTQRSSPMQNLHNKRHLT